MQQISMEFTQRKLRKYHRHNWIIVEALMANLPAIVLADVLQTLKAAIV